MENEQEKNDTVAQTIATYNVIAPDYKLTATPEMRAWEDGGYLAGKRVLVPGCGDGRDSRFLRALGLQIHSFDLSEEMLKIAVAQDLQSTYFRMDLRKIDRWEGTYDGIFASGCLYHFNKREFSECVRFCWALLSRAGVFYLNMYEQKLIPGDGGFEFWVRK